MVDIAKLKEVALFQGLKDSDLEVLSKNLRPLHMEEGEALVTEGVTTRGPLLIITDGNLEVTRKGSDGVSRILAILEPPTAIGEMEFLADIEASATVVAHDEITGFLLPRARFDAMMDADEPAAFHLARSIGRLVSQRLHDTNEMLARALSRLASNPEEEARVQKAQLSANLDALDAELSALLK